LKRDEKRRKASVSSWTPNREKKKKGRGGGETWFHTAARSCLTERIRKKTKKKGKEGTSFGINLLNVGGKEKRKKD